MTNNINNENEIITYMHSDGFYVIRPKQLNIIPIECPICTRMMSDADDAAAYRKHECCHDCMISWVEPNLEKWNSGCRPLQSDVVAKRVDLTSRIIDQFLI